MLSNPSQTLARWRGATNVMIGILVLGSLWGLSEVALGGGLRAANFPYRSGLLTGIGMAVMAMALAIFRRPLIPIGIGLVAASVTLMVVPVLHSSIMCKANSCIALGLEAGSLSLAAVIAGKKAGKSTYGLMGIGAAAAIVASVAFYFIGTHVAPCNYLLSFTSPGSFAIKEGLVWSAFSAILLPFGFTAGEWLATRPLPVLTERNFPLFAGSTGIVMLCWGLSGLVIAAGF